MLVKQFIGRKEGAIPLLTKVDSPLAQISMDEQAITEEMKKVAKSNALMRMLEEEEYSNLEEQKRREQAEKWKQADPLCCDLNMNREEYYRAYQSGRMSRREYEVACEGAYSAASARLYMAVHPELFDRDHPEYMKNEKAKREREERKRQEQVEREAMKVRRRQEAKAQYLKIKEWVSVLFGGGKPK